MEKQINYLRILPCDKYQEINQEILNYLHSINILDSDQGFWNPIPVVDFLKNNKLFLEWLNQTGLKIKTLAVTIGHNINCCGPHIDTPPARFKLSWPILNTEYSYNRWFEEAKENCNKHINTLGGVNYLNVDELRELFCAPVIYPAIIDAGTIHDVWYKEPGQFPRIGLQCQLVNEPKEL